MNINNLPVRKVGFNDQISGEVSLFSPVFRYPQNPILTPAEINEVWNDPALQVITVHNAGVVSFKDETIMLFRSHLRCGKSVIGLARSADGVRSWRIEPKPVLLPASEKDLFAPDVDIKKQIKTEAGGVEDPRVIFIDGKYAITYSAYHAEIKNRVRVCLATTEDFVSFERHGPMLEKEMRNVVIFPEKIENRYVGLFRPNDITEGDLGGTFTQIKTGSSEDWIKGHWEIDPEPVMLTGGGPSAFSDKIGPGAPPVKTSHGWLSLFHGVRSTMTGNPYVLGVALHDLVNPRKVKMSSIPVLFPTRADCRIPESQYTHVPQVVFTCGALDKGDGIIYIYYGGNDTVMNLAVTHVEILAALCEHYGQDPLTGRLNYEL